MAPTFHMQSGGIPQRARRRNPGPEGPATFFQYFLPAGLANARQLTTESHVPEADTADAELADKGMRTAADRAAVVLAGAKLRFAFSLNLESETSHELLHLLLERHAELIEKDFAFLVSGGSRNDGDVHALGILNTVSFHFGEDGVFP